MRGALGVMTAAVATAVLAAWRRVRHDGVQARLARRAARQADAADSIRTIGHGAEPADSIRIVRRSAEPVNSIRVVRRGPPRPEPVSPEPERAEPARGEAYRTEPVEAVHAEPPFPAEAPERGRAEPEIPPLAWDGGSAPLPARIPRPTYWPAVFALGATWAVWGSISSPLLIFGGLAVVTVALAFWIREMIHAGD